jgi:hypothetical protein
MIEIAKNYAIKVHKSINQKYDTHEYEHHLEMTVSIGKKFIYLIPEKDRGDVIGGCWCHDIIEDVSSVTFNDLKKETNNIIAELAYACTNEKGRTRAERANDKYYEGIRNTKYATFIKLCDRLANVKYSLNSGSKMFEMYKKEQKHFKSMLHTTSEYDDMWNYLEEIFKNQKV